MDWHQLHGVEDRLRKVDWDFYGYTTSNHLADLHWYPATFIPQVPAVLIQALTSEGDTVLDPFCGSGVALVESLRLGRNAIGVDCGALACFVSNVKCGIVCGDHSNLLSTVEGFVEELRANTSVSQQAELHPFRSQALTYDDLQAQLDIFLQTRPWLTEWYHRETLEDLFRLKLKIDDIDEPLVRDLLTVCFSSILRSISSQTKSWGHIADNVKPRHLQLKKVFPRFIAQLAKVRRGLEELAPHEAIKDSISFEVHNRDARNMDFMLSESIDLVLTSPPYPKMTDYALSQRLTYYWMGWDIEHSRKMEIGARRKRWQRTFDSDYLQDVDTVIQESRRVLKPNKCLCLILPLFSSVEEGRHGLITKAVGSVEAQGFSEMFKLTRTIPRKRRRHNWPSLDKEQIFIWRKER